MFKDIFVVGASAGGVTALQALCSGLPPDFPGTIFIVQHLAPFPRSELPALLNKAGPLRAISPADGDTFTTGTIYVAAPDLHLLLRNDKILMRRGPRENRSRPAINTLFRSAAVAYGSRVVGVVLTGLLDDGTEGLIAIKAAGGTSIVQDPAQAEWPSMPRSALARDHVDFKGSIAEIANLLSRLAIEPAGPATPLPEELIVEDKIAAVPEFALAEPVPVTPGTASKISCPDCGGVLNGIVLNGHPHYRCQVGHAFTGLGLVSAQQEELERALAVAVRTHRDRINLFRQMQESAVATGLSHSAQRWSTAMEEAEGLIKVLEKAMQSLRVEDTDMM